MRILKIRRGYTTNSSASSEFIPAPAPTSGPVAAVASPVAPAATVPVQPAQTAVTAPKPFPVPVRAVPKATSPATGQLSSQALSGPATSKGVQAGSSESGAATQASQVVQPPAVQTPPSAHGWGNTLVFGGFAALVALAFVGERVARRIIRRIRNRDEAE